MILTSTMKGYFVGCGYWLLWMCLLSRQATAFAPVTTPTKNFLVSRRHQSPSHHLMAPLSSLALDDHHIGRSIYMSSIQLWASSSGSDNDGDEKTTTKDVADNNFDGEGFANYLLPYAIAVVAALGVTAAFVKFVLMDY